MFQSIDCFNNGAGIANSSIIPDYQMNASSQLSHYYQAAYGRLNETRGLKAWCASSYGRNDEWLQIDLGETFRACGLATQGYGVSSSAYVKAFKLLYSDDEKRWKTYQNGSGVEVVSFILINNNKEMAW